MMSHASSQALTSDVCTQGESKKLPPPTTFDDIFAWAESFYITFCTFIGNLYPHVYRISFIYLNI